MVSHLSLSSVFSCQSYWLQAFLLSLNDRKSINVSVTWDSNFFDKTKKRGAYRTKQQIFFDIKEVCGLAKSLRESSDANNIPLTSCVWSHALRYFFSSSFMIIYYRET